jgi:hypothetical protein
MQFPRPPRHQVSNIVQMPQVNVFPWRQALAVRAGPLWLVPGLFDNLGLGQILNSSVRRVGDVLARTRPAWRFGGSWFHIPSLMQFSRFGTATSVAMLQCLNLLVFVADT